MSLSSVVDVSISRDTAVLSKQSFNTIAVLSDEVDSENAIEFVASLDEAEALLTGGDDAFAYGIVKTIFMQNPKPTKVALIPLGDSVTNSLNAAKLASDDWYMLVYASETVSTDLANQKAVADWVESNIKICGLVSNVSAIVDSTAVADTASIAAYVKAQGYARTFVCYSSKCDSTADNPEFVNAAILSVISQWTPGSYTCKFKKLAGVSAEALTGTQLTNAKNKNVNTYISVAGRGMFQHGNMAEGEWIDIIVFVDWVKSNIETNVASALLNSKKIPFDDTGLNVIGSCVSSALEAGITSGGFTNHKVDEDGNVIGGYEVSVPKSSEISSSDKNARTISANNPIRFVGYLAGAIHAITIRGTVTV